MASIKERCYCLLPMFIFLFLTYTFQPHFQNRLSDFAAPQQDGFFGLIKYSNDPIEKKRAKQKEFFDLIRTTQTNCSTERVLIHELHGQGFNFGFACIHHFVGLSLLLSVATKRTMVMTGNFIYFNSECTRGHKHYTANDSWHCVYDELTPCKTSKNMVKHRDESWFWHRARQFYDVFGYYYSNHYKVTYFGDPTRKYGDILSWKFLVSSVYKQAWLERFPGQFWVRAHVQYYLWNTLNGESKKIVDDMACVKKIKVLKQSGQKYIGFHIRKTDNLGSIVNMVRDPNQTMSLENFVHFANKIRNDTNDGIRNSNLQTIFVSTDNSGIIEQIKDINAKDDSVKEGSIFENWNIIYNENVLRSGVGVEWEWFSKDGHLDKNNFQSLYDIIMDIELLRTADFIVGTSTSNVFRLATELHYVTNWVTNDYEETVFTVDAVPWYQNP